MALVQPETVVKDLKDSFPGKDPGKFLGQAGMPPQLAPDLDSVALRLDRKSSSGADPQAGRAGQAYLGIKTDPLPVQGNGPFPANLETRPAGRAAIFNGNRLLGLYQPGIRDLRPGAAVWASGDADGKLGQGVDVPGQSPGEQLRPTGVLNHLFQVQSQIRIRLNQIGALPALHPPAEFDAIGFPTHSQNSGYRLLFGMLFKTRATMSMIAAPVPAGIRA